MNPAIKLFIESTVDVLDTDSVDFFLKIGKQVTSFGEKMLHT